MIFYIIIFFGYFDLVVIVHYKLAMSCYHKRQNKDDAFHKVVIEPTFVAFTVKMRYYGLNFIYPLQQENLILPSFYFTPFYLYKRLSL